MGKRGKNNFCTANRRIGYQSHGFLSRIMHEVQVSRISLSLSLSRFSTQRHHIRLRSMINNRKQLKIASLILFFFFFNGKPKLTKNVTDELRKNWAFSKRRKRETKMNPNSFRSHFTVLILDGFLALLWILFMPVYISVEIIKLFIVNII